MKSFVCMDTTPETFGEVLDLETFRSWSPRTKGKQELVDSISV